MAFIEYELDLLGSVLDVIKDRQDLQRKVNDLENVNNILRYQFEELVKNATLMQSHIVNLERSYDALVKVNTPLSPTIMPVFDTGSLTWKNYWKDIGFDVIEKGDENHDIVGFVVRRFFPL